MQRKKNIFFIFFLFTYLTCQLLQKPRPQTLLLLSSFFVDHLQAIKLFHICIWKDPNLAEKFTKLAENIFFLSWTLWSLLCLFIPSLGLQGPKMRFIKNPNMIEMVKICRGLLILAVWSLTIILHSKRTGHGKQLRAWDRHTDILYKTQGFPSIHPP